MVETYIRHNVMPPILFEEYIDNKHTLLHTDDYLADAQMLDVLGVANYWGALIRVSFLKYVHRTDVDPASFWNAALKVFVVPSKFWPDGEEMYRVSRKQIDRLTQRFPRPDWVLVGLMGENWSKLHAMCKAFCAEMDGMEVELEAGEFEQVVLF